MGNSVWGVENYGERVKGSVGEVRGVGVGWGSVEKCVGG